jgi:urease accessory protein
LFVGGSALGCVIAAQAASLLAAASLVWLEPVLAGSVALLGLALARSALVSIHALAIACSVLGALHGAAHGFELTGAQPVVAAGLVAATATLHAFGYATGWWLRARAAVALRAVGAASAMAGCVALISKIA